MNVLTTSLFLFGVLLTQTRAGTLNQDLSVSPLSEPLYLFDVISDAGADAVKGALSGLDIRRSFKMVGENRYIFVIVDPQDVSALSQIAFPAGSSAMHTPLQHAADFFAMYNVDGWQEVDTAQTFGDIVVNLNVWELSLPELATPEQYTEKMVQLGNMFLGPHGQDVTFASYLTVSRMPAQMYYFNDIDSNAYQNMVKDALNAVGVGFGTLKLSQRSLVQI